ncbi:MAG: POTRA domain-containing protein, partial [Candidatus Binatia bacterium]
MVWLSWMWWFCLARLAAAAEPGLPIDAVRVTGNLRVEEVAIRVHVRSQPGAPVDPAVVEQDVRAIYAMGFFEDVRAEVVEENGRRVLVYQVKERPLIREVEIEGNKKVSTEDLEAA